MRQVLLLFSFCRWKNITKLLSCLEIMCKVPWVVVHTNCSINISNFKKVSVISKTINMWNLGLQPTCQPGSNPFSHSVPTYFKPQLSSKEALSNFFFFNLFYLFIYLWLSWVFVSVRGLSPVAASGGHSSSQCAGLSLSWPLLLQSTGSRRAGSVIVAHGPSCSAACGIFPDQGSNPCPLHWQADSQPLRHQGSP